MPVLLVLGALAAAVVAQGGYYLPGRILAAALAGLGLVLLARLPLGSPLVWACAALGLWALVRAAAGGSVVSGLPVVAAVGCLLAGALVVAQADVGQRELCSALVVGVGVLVALTGWAAVVWRIPSWSVVADGLVRAASTVTYPNAAAALLAALAVLVVVGERGRWRGAAACVLLVGLGATLSRAGVIALAVGLLVACVAAGPRKTVENVAAPLTGALVALAALVPSFPAARPAQALLAIGGLLLGVGVTLALERVAPKVRIALLAVGVVVAGVLGVDRLEKLLTGRLSFASPDRSGALDAALKLVSQHPVAGVGPGRGWFVWVRADGEARVMRYVHNEYLQVLVELGVIGLGLVACVLVAVVLTVRRRVDGPWAGAVAALAALAVHSGFDFLWHLPVVLLTAGLLVGLASSHPPEKENP